MQQKRAPEGAQIGSSTLERRSRHEDPNCRAKLMDIESMHENLGANERVFKSKINDYSRRTMKRTLQGLGGIGDVSFRCTTFAVGGVSNGLRIGVELDNCLKYNLI